MTALIGYPDAGRNAPSSDLSPAQSPPVELPAIVSQAGERAAIRFLEFFAVTIRNPNTRRAYVRNVLAFLAWCEDRGILRLDEIRPITVAGYIEQLQRTHSKPSVKQALASIRNLLDWLVVGQIIELNPAHAVRGPKYAVLKGKTPILTADETRQLFESISGDLVIDKRDRALIATMFFTFARISAVVSLALKDYYPQGKRYWLRFMEKGGIDHAVPVHHKLEEYIDEYIQAAGISGDENLPLFRSATTTGKALTSRAPSPADVWRVIRRRAKEAGINPRIGNHSFRATGITNYLGNGGILEHAQRIAAHASPKTTKLYDRTADDVSLDEIEKITV